MHAYDFFRTLADEADIAVTFDAAKMLSYQWHREKRGAELLSELDKLPLQRCFEIQVSASDAKSGRAFEGSDETLFEAQIELVQLLSKRCSNVRVVAYDGPLVGADGEVSDVTRVGLARLRDIVSAWSGRKPSGSFELRA